MTTYGKMIRKFRKEKGYTQAQLASKAGIGLNTLRRYESDERQPNLEKLNRIAAALEVQPSELIASMRFTIPSEMLFGTIDLRDETEKAIDAKVSLLNDLGKQKALDYVTDLSEQEKYKKQSDEE